MSGGVESPLPDEPTVLSPVSMFPLRRRATSQRIAPTTAARSATMRANGRAPELSLVSTSATGGAATDVVVTVVGGDVVVADTSGGPMRLRRPAARAKAICRSTG